ncbi:hypothetical protein [Actinacidiphila acididurans]|uniref:hypothetical protein n=1 Tax=Actinacidiphila acididurans TaxID=2784346 RepID=UPI0027DE81EA|nr:hypothetical protein [Actinacidiphila acididurans]
MRRRHGWSYQDLAKVIAEHARALGVPMAARREKVWRWEHWGVVPEADSQRALARALGVPFRELELRPWPRWLPAHGGMPDELAWTLDGSLTALSALVDDAADDPRGYPITDERTLRGAVADWTAAQAGPAPDPSLPREGEAPRLLTDADDPAAQDTAGEAFGWPGGGPVGPGDDPVGVDGTVVEWLETGVLGLRRLDDRLGGGAVRHRVAADLRLVCGLLRRGQPSGRDTRARLLRVAADLAQLGGWAATDTGRLGAAQRHYLTGLRLAHTAGDRPMAVALWGGLALQEVIAGRPNDAVAAAEAAVRAAGSAPPAVRALAASRLARAHAALGAEGAFRRAMAEAERRLEAARTDPGPPWLYWFDPAELTAQTGLALLDLGAAAEAAPLLEKALAAQDPAFLRDRSLYSVRAAQAHALTGDLDTALELGREASRLSRYCGSPRLADALDTLKEAVDARR